MSEIVEIVLDIETTGLSLTKGHKIIEIGCVELKNRKRTGRVFHKYINPQRKIDPEAINVHGIKDEFLTDKEKEMLGIPTWKAVTLAKTFMNGQGEVIKVKLKNRYAPMFNKAKTYEVQDGESFQIAKKFAKEVEDRIKFQ